MLAHMHPPVYLPHLCHFSFAHADIIITIINAAHEPLTESNFFIFKSKENYISVIIITL